MLVKRKLKLESSVSGRRRGGEWEDSLPGGERMDPMSIGDV